MVKFLLTSPLTDVNCKDLNGNTPLHYSGISGSNQLAMILIENGGNALQQNRKKMLPLHSCIFSDHVVTFKTILIETDKQMAK
jgi:ankyrin repeat protein